MIARHDTPLDRDDRWATLAAPLPASAISWRQDGRAVQRDGRWIARFVCYVGANTVRERLDTVVPGEWDLTLDLLPALPGDDGEPTCSFKARLQILGVIREDVGTGRDYRSAATDAFKRAAVRFGIAHELYAYEQNWVQVDGDGRYAKPLEDPAAAYARRYGTVTGQAAGAPRREAAHVVEHDVTAAGEASVEPATDPRASDDARAGSRWRVRGAGFGSDPVLTTFRGAAKRLLYRGAAASSVLAGDVRYGRPRCSMIPTPEVRMVRRFPPLRPAALLLALLLGALSAACAGRPRLPSGEATVVTFVNESTSQADLFAVAGGGSYRLGTVGPNRSEELRVPDHVVRAGTGGVNFVARLFPGRGTLQSGLVTLQAGDALTVRLPAALNLLVVTPG